MLYNTTVRKKNTLPVTVILLLCLIISSLSGCAPDNPPAETIPETESETVIRPTDQTDTETESETVIKPDGQTDTETESETVIKPDDQTDTETESETETSAPFVVITPAQLGDSVRIHSEAQAKYLAGNKSKINAYADGTKELSYPVPVVLSWSTESSLPEENFLSYTIRIGLTSDLSDADEYYTVNNSLSLYNLFIGTEYFWNVSAVYTDGEFLSETEHFTTEATAPRNLYIEGVTNVRDLGGWATEDGGTVKQGMIFRGGRLNTSNQTNINVEISDSSAEFMRLKLGIRSEIDLRTTYNNEVGGIYSSVLGDEVNYYSCPMTYAGNVLTSNTEMIRTVFEILSDESNYPIYFHCNIGADRTGMLAFLINGLVGVSENDLTVDYLFTNFGNIGGNRSPYVIRSYVEVVGECDGDTLAMQIYNYLVGIGVPSSQLDKIIEILRTDV